MLFAFLLASQVAHVTPVLQRQPKVRDTLAAFQTVKAPALAQWKASAADEADVRRVVDTYFARTDTGQMEAALSMYKATAIRDRRGWLEQRRQLVRKLGAGKRRITAVTWYVNPPGPSNRAFSPQSTSLVTIPPHRSTAGTSPCFVTDLATTRSCGTSKTSLHYRTGRSTLLNWRSCARACVRANLSAAYRATR